jgi:hypothetical protein
VGNPLS